jgi:hypothetical protein
MYASQIRSTPFLQQGNFERDGQPKSEVAADKVNNNPWDQGYFFFLVRYARMWP